MTWTYATPTINDRLQAVIDRVDAGAGPGQIQLGTAGMGTVLCTVILNKPCATISSGVLTFSGTPIADPSAAASGLAAAMRVTDSAGTVVASGTVGMGGSGADATISLQNIVAGSIITFTSGLIQGR